MSKKAYAFTVSTGNQQNSNHTANEIQSNATFNLPLRMVQKLQSRNKPPTSIYNINSNNDGDNDPTQDMINELIGRLCIKHKYLSPTVLIDIIAIEIRSYLSEELHIRLSQPLRHFIHSSFHPFGIALFPPRKSDISCPLIFNDKVQFQQLTDFQLDNYASKFSNAVFIGIIITFSFFRANHFENNF